MVRVHISVHQNASESSRVWYLDGGETCRSNVSAVAEGSDRTSGTATATEPYPLRGMRVCSPNPSSIWLCWVLINVVRSRYDPV